MKKKYWEMNAEELSEATAQFDKPMVAKQSRPLNAKERKMWERLQKASNRKPTRRGK